jgi:uracil-DNA glycosylase
MSATQKFINIEHALSGVHQSFKQLMIGADMKQHFINALTNIDPTNISPNANNIFEFARYKQLDEIRVVIIGQDPYPNPEHAHGLCFSSLDKKVPASLKNIYSCLEEQGLIKSAKDMTTSNLQSWARQGVLMLNMALTTEIGKTAQHMKLWEPITKHIINTLGAADRPIVFMLWGNYAKGMIKLITSKKAIILQETHPSPISQARLEESKRFKYCTHFTSANAALINAGYPPICWDPNNISTHVVYTDGSGLNTGNCNSKASYATLFAKGPRKGTMLYGKLSPVSILNLNKLTASTEWTPLANPCWIDDNRAYTIRSVHSKTKTWKEPCATVYISGAEPDMIFPNSQRGEGMAILMAFEHVINIGMPAHLEIVTDSMFWIDMVQKYIPNWVEQNNPFHMQKNPDIVSRIWKAMGNMLTIGINYTLRHIKSHGKDKNADPFDVAMNDAVDKMAKSALNNGAYADLHRLP